jgi:NADPH:quinone reductase-like Zn-dependent oxidoreductase
MKAIRFHGYGGPSVYAYEDADDPKAGAGEVLVEVHAASLNAIDWKIRNGDMKAFMPVDLPAIPGRDVAGVISGTKERVMGFVNGTFAEKVAAPRAALATIPEGMSDEQAAAIPLVLISGAQLIELGVKPTAGMTVLVSGAVGGVGRAAVYVAKQHGAKVIAGVRKSQKAEASRLGADSVVALDDDDDLAGIRDVDAIADAVGGKTAEKLVPCLRTGGIFATVLGAPPPGAEERGATFVPVFAKADTQRLEALARDVQEGKLVIPVSRVFKLSEIKEATELAEKGGVGRIVIKP